MRRLRFERLDRGITQETLALATKIPQPIISLIETGTWNPSPTQLAALGRALHIAQPEVLLRDVVLSDAEVAR